jgi:biotin transport system substrate-specific component
LIASQTAAPPAARLLERNVAMRHLALVLLFGALTALSAQIRWLLPGNPVPVTGQVFVVLLSGAFLGARLGAASQLGYVVFGIMGAPVFAGGTSGPLALVGPTGGYILGFVLAAALVGRRVERNNRTGSLALAMVVGLAAIYVCGGMWLACWSHVASDLPWAEAVAKAWALGVMPFLLPDAVKVLLAIGAARTALRDEAPI